MSYRLWPAALISGAALAATAVVVGDHVAQTSDGCLGSAGRFTATPVSWPSEATSSGIAGKLVPNKVAIGRPTLIEQGGQTIGGPHSDGPQITGCLDVDRIEIPAPVPAGDGRA
ncbi:MAG: hypothetical protein H0T54_10475 [Geodermatophilaceae bacterium]|nr:hypothetical protein [Geodermatophilaceae bacterium]